MKAKAPAKPSSRRRPVELLLSPVDNNRLANLCGVLDENLRQIETALDVTIARRGERFTIHGTAEAAVRVRLSQSQTVHALARMKSGKLLAASHAVTVAASGCGM